MGSATVTENIGDGQYEVQIDKAIDQINAEIEEKETRINEFNSDLIPAATEIYNTAFSEYGTEKTSFETLVSELRTLQGSGTPAEIQEKMAEVRAQTSELLEADTKKNIARRELATLNLQLLSVQKELEKWQELLNDPDDIRTVWAVDYTPDISVGAKVGTVEINGEAEKRPIDSATGLPDATVSEKVQITAGGEDGTGLITPAPVLDGQEHFTAEASKPGWQKWKPTFRAATITDIDHGLNTCDVNLNDAQSSVIRTKAVNNSVGEEITAAQGFDINQTETLTDVSFDYMTCNSTAFTGGDNVVIEFLEQDWRNPVVKGFVESPRACHVQIKLRLKTATEQQDFIDFCSERKAAWQTFEGLLTRYYSGGGSPTGVLVDLMAWHQDCVGKWIGSLYGAVQAE